MSILKLKEIFFRGGADPASNYTAGADSATPGVFRLKRGTVGGGEQDVMRLDAGGDMSLPAAQGVPNPRGVVLQMMLAQMLPKIIPAVPGLRSFLKTSGRSVSIKAGTAVVVGGMVKTYGADTAVVMPDVLTPGEDYGIWVLPSGALFASADPYAAPYAPTPAQAGAVKLGGFHYGLLAHDALLSGGGFAQAAPSMVWTQSDVDKIAGINVHTLWDDHYRPTCDPRGMACVSNGAGAGQFWFDLYFTGSNHTQVGTSRAGSDVASGTVLPKIPAMFGGDGTAKYTSLNWYEANEIAFSHGKRLPSCQEFAAAAFGVTEAQSLGGAATTIPTTARQAGYTSKWGGEQMTGHQNVIGAVAQGAGGTGWIAGAVRGQTYGTAYCPILGGARGDAAAAGSRCSLWSHPAHYTVWANGMRAFCDHKRPR